MSAPVTFWFDYSSPFAYLAQKQLHRFDEAGVEVRFQPFFLGGLFKDIGTPMVPLGSYNAPKQAYLRADMRRWAERVGVPVVWPSRFPLNTIAALRLTLAAPPEKVRALADVLFDRCWVDDADPTDPEVLGGALEAAGLPRALLEETRNPEVKAALKDATTRAAEVGLCGAPTFQVGDRLFWGQDRIGFVLAAAVDGWCPDPERPEA